MERKPRSPAWALLALVVALLSSTPAVRAGPTAGSDPFTDCLCACACSDVGWACGQNGVSCFFYPEPLDASPACNDPSGGQCVCRGAGCGRAALNVTQECFDGCAPLLIATPTPTIAAGGDPTPTPTSQAPAYPDFYPRGDADCSLTLSAADVVAHVRGRGASICGNDDCDRDGVLTADDADCSARCLFGECPILSAAPEVSEVLAESAAETVALSLVRIRLVRSRGLAVANGFVQVKVGDQSAGIVEATEDELVVALPALDPGPADLVVLDGEAASPRFALAIAESSPIGEPDGLADLLTVLDGALETFTAADLELLYGEEGVPLILALTEDLRAELERFEAEGLEDLPAEIRGVLDALVDGGGVVDAMREALDGIGAAALTGRGAGAAAVAEGTRRVVTEIYVATIELTKKYSAAKLLQFERAARLARLSQLARLAGRFAGVGAAWLAAIKAVIGLPDAAGRPIPVGFRFLDQERDERDFPTAGGFMHVRGCRIGESHTGMELTLANGATFPLQPAGTCAETDGLDLCPFAVPPFVNGCVAYRLPASVGFCGTVSFRIFNDAALRIEGTPFLAPVQPEILAGRIGRPAVINLEARGVHGCEPILLLDGPEPATTRWRTNQAVVPAGAQHVNGRVTAAKDLPSGCPFGEVPPGRYRATLEVADVTNEEDESPALDVMSNVTRLIVECADATLSISSGQLPIRTECAFTPGGRSLGGLPLERTCFPIDTEKVVVAVSDAGTAVFEDGQAFDPASGSFTLRTIRKEPGGAERFVTHARGIRPGTVTLNGTAFFESGATLAQTTTSFTLEVRDLTGPSVPLVSPCSGTIAPGETLHLGVFATDNFLMSRLVVSVPAGVAPNPTQEFPCVLDLGPDVCPPFIDCDTCRHDFDVPLNENLTAGSLAVEIMAVDGSGLSTTRQCVFDVTGSTGRIAGTVRGQGDGAPLTGVTVSLLDGEGNVVASASTVAGGSYSFEDVRTGSYVVRFERSGFRSSERAVTVNEDETTTADVILEVSTGPSFRLRRIADTSTTVAGFGPIQTIGRFAIDSGRVVFAVLGPGTGAVLVAEGAGTPRVLVDHTVTPPGPPSQSSFNSLFLHLSIDGDRVAFTNGNTNEDVWLKSATVTDPAQGLQRIDIYDPFDPARADDPPELNALREQFDLALEDDRVVFSATLSQFESMTGDFTAIYLAEVGDVARLFSILTPIPFGTGNFTQFPTSNALRSVSFAGNTVAFRGLGAGGQDGVYVATDLVEPRLIADTSMRAPGRSVEFDFFDGVSTDGDNVAFVGRFAGGSGVYARIRDSLREIAGSGTPIPGKDAAFTSVTDYTAIDGDTVAFGGRLISGGVKDGVYVSAGGQLGAVVEADDVLDGKTVQRALLDGAESLDGDQVVFRVRFTDGTTGLYVAAIEPG